MKIKPYSIKYYQFKSCLRLYLLARGPIQYLKTTKKASPDVLASCTRTRGGKIITPNSIAACACKQCASGRFDGENQAFKQLKALKTNSNRLQPNKPGGVTNSGANNHA